MPGAVELEAEGGEFIARVPDRLLGLEVGLASSLLAAEARRAVVGRRFLFRVASSGVFWRCDQSFLAASDGAARASIRSIIVALSVWMRVIAALRVFGSRLQTAT